MKDSLVRRALGEAVETRNASLRFTTTVSSAHVDHEDSDVYVSGSLLVQWKLTLVVSSDGIESADVTILSVKGDLDLSPLSAGGRLGQARVLAINYTIGADEPDIEDLEAKDFAMMTRSWIVKTDFNPAHASFRKCVITNIKITESTGEILVEFT